MRRALLLALLLLLPTAPAWAQAPATTASPPPPDAVEPAPELPVAVEVTLGFQNRVPADGFLSVAIDLGNRGETKNAVVTLRAQEAGNTLLRLGPLELEGGARRRVVGVVPARPVVEAGALIATVRTTEDVLLGQCAVSPEATPARLLVALDRRGAAPADLSSLRTMDGPPQGNQPQEVRWTTVVVSRLEDLPQSPLAYSGLGAVLLGDLELEGWPEPEARALGAWVARGGHLLVSVGPRARLLRGRSLLGRTLGAGLRALPDAAPDRDVALDDVVESLRATYGLEPGDEPAPAPAVATLLPGPEDEVVLRAGERPFVVRRRHGLGQVTLIGADLWSPPFLHSPVTTRLLEALLDRGPSHAPRARILFKELAEVRQPARVGPAFAGLIVFALLAGPGIYFALRAKKRGIWLWVAIPAITLVFTAGVPMYRVFLRDAESTIVGVRLVEGWAGQQTTVETTDVLIFSGSLDAKRFEYSGDDAVAFAVIPPRRRTGPELGSVLGGGPEGASFSMPVTLWGTRYVSFEGCGRAATLTGGVSLRLGADPTQVEPRAHVRLRWDGPTLREAWVIYPGQGGAGPALAHPLEEGLRAGVEVDVDARPFTAHSIAGRESDLGGLMVERLLADRYMALVETERAAFVIGISDETPPVRALPNVRTRAFATVHAFEVPITYEDAVPFGVARVAREGATIAAVGSGAVEREVRTRLNVPSGGREAASARVRVASQRVRSLLRLRVDAWDFRAEEWVALLPRDEGDEEREGTQRRIDLPLEDPARFVTPAGEVLVRQRFLRPKQDADEGHAATIDVAVEWAR